MIRLLNKIYANLFGYYWIPCPLCGKEMGGHENNINVYKSEDIGKASMAGKSICKDCAKTGICFVDELHSILIFYE
jgi:hypothetical protein